MVKNLKKNLFFESFLGNIDKKNNQAIARLPFL